MQAPHIQQIAMLETALRDANAIRKALGKTLVERDATIAELQAELRRRFVVYNLSAHKLLCEESEGGCGIPVDANGNALDGHTHTGKFCEGHPYERKAHAKAQATP